VIAVTIGRRILPGVGVNRRAVLILTAGHAGADFFQGAVPALVPFLVAERNLSYANAGLLIFAASVASSVIQPLAGLAGDRFRAAWLSPFGLLLSAAGLATATSFDSFVVIALALVAGGLGVALFHPEAVRATRQAAPTNPGVALGVFAVGGNLGFALGPAAIVPLAATFDLRAAGFAALLPVATALSLVFFLRTRSETWHVTGDYVKTTSDNDWRVFALASAAATARTGFMFGLMAFVPSWFAIHLDAPLEMGSAAIAAMLFAGALGTYTGGRLGDAYGRSLVIVYSLALVVPLATALPFASPTVAFVLLVVIGFSMDANFYPLVITAQDALPQRVGFASGVVIGLSVGVGAASTGVLGQVADTHGLPAALWCCAMLAGLALTFAILGQRRVAAR
jgi:FSR family fosmidomycin resistance protein-like MFS transporter